ncbi:hypothetical protein BBW65_06150 [Helicobacter enhydrae]|uniref:Ferrochelatase n=1 Tax=Helicobacter enhydrae TaxID=222136 RepID=A0A1B1U6M8_9HELI|nr:hypothetical protein [Helicobacter enhydrae]ANV98400.1 hypothetical protein BBW65_06150 [Helicobacter enhydrae]
MRILEIVEIINGKLLNTPSISAFTHITTDLDKVSRGALFFVSAQSQIPQAIKLGAYGVVFESNLTKIIDNEIAWIEVDSLQDASIRLMRYQILTQSMHLLFLKPIEFELALQICAKNENLFLQGSFLECLEAVQNQNAKRIIIKDTHLLDLSLDYTSSIEPAQDPFKIISYTLFTSKLYYNGERYEIPIPHFLLKPLASVITLFQNEGIELDLASIKGIDEFQPLFINTRNKLCKYGQSERVLIAQTALQEFKDILAYMLRHAKWAQVICFAPQDYVEFFDQLAPTYPYQSTQDLLAQIKTATFNFALIFDTSTQDLLEYLQQPDQEQSLFE